MKCALQTWGSTGDIQPFLALAAGLADAGHEVHLGITDVEAHDYQQAAIDGGFRVTQVATPVIDKLEDFDAIGERCLRHRDPMRQARIIFSELFTPALAAMHELSRALATNNDIMLRHHVLHCAQSAAEAAAITDVSVMFAHNMMPSRYIRPAMFPPLGSVAYGLAWRAARLVINHLLLEELNRTRRSDGLTPYRDVIGDSWIAQRMTLIAVSPSFLTPPVDWPSNVHLSGFLAGDEAPGDAQLARTLADFLDAGPPPILFNFGSMMARTSDHQATVVEHFLAAAAATGQRAIIQLPNPAAASLPRHRWVYYAERLNHHVVMPRCALVVHHGGAGTSHAALRAGRPSVVVPHVADQFFWAAELRRLGVATAPLSLRRLTAKGLSKRINSILRSPTMSTQATTLGDQLRQQNGVAKAVELVSRAAAQNG